MNYDLNFDGSLGDYIRLLRKSKKINSIDLSKKIGKSDSYISHIENGRYKTPDYATLYKVFQILGIKEGRIEDHLYYFGILSPEREAWEEQNAIAEIERMENPSQEDLDEMDRQSQYFSELEDQEMSEKEIEERFNTNKTQISHSQDNADVFVEDMLNAHVKEINKVFANMIDHDISNAFDFVLGLSNTMGNATTNISLYKFLIKFFNEKIYSLDNEGLIKVLNTLYLELNRVDRERTAFGEPHQRYLINDL